MNPDQDTTAIYEDLCTGLPVPILSQDLGNSGIDVNDFLQPQLTTDSGTGVLSSTNTPLSHSVSHCGRLCHDSDLS
jgi:hypothetical protein